MKNYRQQCVIRNGGDSTKNKGLWLASTSSRFDSELLRNPPLRIHSTLPATIKNILLWG
jgi:hypothetical protein